MKIKFWFFGVLLGLLLLIIYLVFLGFTGEVVTPPSKTIQLFELGIFLFFPFIICGGIIGLIIGFLLKKNYLSFL